VINVIAVPGREASAERESRSHLPTRSCAHAAVRLRIETQNETTRGWWACQDCGAPFVPAIDGAVRFPPHIDAALGKEYLSVRELAARIPYTEGAIRNLMSQGRLKLGVHYVKPRGRVAFCWSAIRAWLAGQEPTAR
jgi:hypothetical protein